MLRGVPVFVSATSSTRLKGRQIPHRSPRHSLFGRLRKVGGLRLHVGMSLWNASLSSSVVKLLCMRPCRKRLSTDCHGLWGWTTPLDPPLIPRLDNGCFGKQISLNLLVVRKGRAFSFHLLTWCSIRMALWLVTSSQKPFGSWFEP